MGKPDMLVVGGGVRRKQGINEVSDLGVQNLAEDRKRIPSSFNLNSKAEYEKRNALRRSCWIRSGLIVEIYVKGRRHVS